MEIFKTAVYVFSCLVIHLQTIAETSKEHLTEHLITDSKAFLPFQKSEKKS